MLAVLVEAVLEAKELLDGVELLIATLELVELGVVDAVLDEDVCVLVQTLPEMLGTSAVPPFKSP